jgi:outer membrane protein TolC
MATRLYSEGETEFLGVLDAQRAVSLAEDALAQSQQQLATDLVALFKALGGGWESFAPAGSQSPEAASPPPPHG